MIADPLDRLPPQNLDAERQAIGCVLLQPRLLDDLAAMLRPSDFYADSHRRLYACLLAMDNEGRQIDPAILVDRLRTAGELEAVGGTAAIAEIVASVGVWQHWRTYAAIVLRESKRRQIIHAASDILHAAWTEQPEPAIAKAEEILGAIRTGDYDTEPVSMLDACVAAMAEVEDIVARRKAAGYMTGLEEFDETIGGIFPGELTLIAARPSQGKTSLALQVAAHIADRGRRVYFATLEMSRVEIALKRLCSVSGVSNQRVRSGKITREDQARLMEAGRDVGVQNLYLHDWAEIRPYDIARAARRLQADVVFVDYLQIVTAPDGSKKRYEQVGDISKQLKQIARKGMAVVACAQIGRQAEQGKVEGPPRLSHLRESGNIEQDADMAILLWRPEGGIKGKGRHEGSEWDAEMDVAKNRKGITGRFRLAWDGDTTTFRPHGYAPPQEWSEFSDFS
jgi:replicative DNA helicase